MKGEDKIFIETILNNINRIISLCDEEFDNEPVGDATIDELPFTLNEFLYKDEQLIENISFNEEASGIKNIVIVKRLLSNGVLHNNSMLIIDEPEVNLHPDWQMKFAEILVMFQKEMKI